MGYRRIFIRSWMINFLTGIIYICITGNSTASAQVETGNDTISNIPVSGDVISVFLDCSRCDNSFIRQEINYINFARDPELALDYVQDQLALPKGDASLEDVLLQQRQLATDYGISVSLGLSYSFGSVFNNVINTRL